LAHDVEQSLRDHVGTDALGSAIDEDHELVAPHPPDGVRPAQRALHSPGDQDQQVVASFVAERVVDVLEVVEVDEQHRAKGVGAAVALK
jgi:hypothetical protein